MDRKELEKEYRKLAKQADQRLVRLEAYQHDKNFKTATLWAYPRAMTFIERWSGPGATRFNTKPPERDQDLVKKIADIKSFLNMKSSTKQGIIEFYKKKAASINKDHQTNFTWQQIGELFEDGGAWDTLREESFGSDTIFDTIGNYEANKDKIVKQILDEINKIARFSPNDSDKHIEAVLKEKGIEDEETIQNIINMKRAKGGAGFDTIVQTANALGTYLPGNKQERQDMIDMANVRSVKWEDLLG